MNDSPVPSGSLGPAPSKPVFAEFAQRHAAWLILAPFVLVSLAIFLVKRHDHQVGMTDIAIAKARASGDAKTVVAGLEAMIRLEPKREAECRRQMGDAFLDMNDYAQAFDQFQKVKQLVPDIDLDRPFMICNFELGRLQEGRACRDRVLKAKPNDPAANYYMAVDFMREGKLREAAQKLRLAVSDENWDKRAEALRQEMAKKVFEKGAPLTTSAAAPAIKNTLKNTLAPTLGAAARHDGASTASRARGRARASTPATTKTAAAGLAQAKTSATARH
jgi:tetratricopeptide (TPR) repeat protein